MNNFRRVTISCIAVFTVATLAYCLFLVKPDALTVHAAGGLTPQPINMPNFPIPSATVDGWVTNNDQDSIRIHGWELWTGISSITKQSNGWPIWETWYTDTEVQNGKPEAKLNAMFRALRDSGRPSNPFHRQRQFNHAARNNRFAAALAVMDGGAGVIGFNKFNVDYAQFVWSNGYNSGTNLWNIQAKWPPNTPVANRAIMPFPAPAIGLKPTFQIVHGPNNQGGITLLNYWLGDLTTGPQNSTNPVHPTWNTWKQCVVVNSGTGQVPSGLTCQNGGQPSGVVPITQFYNFALSAGEAKQICNLQPDVQCPVQAGDYAVLVGMHMTTKEDSNWTWQTFWWNYNQPFPYGPPPSNIPAPFNNYAMCTGYSMTVNPPNNSQGTNVLCYNPYLETGLSINGIQSNCMSCHGVASFGNNPNNPGYPPFITGTTSYISVAVPQDDITYFDCQTTADFSWFLGDLAAATNPPPQPSCTTALGAK